MDGWLGVQVNFSAWRGKPGFPFGLVMATVNRGKSATLWHLQMVLLGFALVCGLLRISFDIQRTGVFVCSVWEIPRWPRGQ